jgi:hypothetical protein
MAMLHWSSGFNCDDSKDQESVVFRLATGDNSQVEISVGAAQLDELIALLGTPACL